MAHTPGPWTFDGDNPANQGFDIAMSDGGILATAYYDVTRDDYSVQQAEANAHLIGAAPELLAQARAFYEYLIRRQEIGLLLTNEESTRLVQLGTLIVKVEAGGVQAPQP